MSVHLTSSDLHHVRAAQETILSLPAAGSVGEWCTETVAATGRLLRSDRVVAVIPHLDGVETRSSPEMAPFLEPAQRAFDYVDVGANHYRVPQVEASQALRRRKGLELWTNRMIEALHGSTMEEAGWYYHEFVEAAGVAEGGGMTIRLPLGEGMLLATPGHPGPNPLGDGWLDVMGLLLPSFRSAVRHLQQSQRRSHELLGAIDELRRPVWLWSRDGAELHRTPKLRALLDEEGVESRLHQEAAELVRECGLLRTRRKADSDRVRSSVGHRRVASARGGAVRLSAVFLGSQLQGTTELVLVEVERSRPVLPSPAMLQARWALTPRQAEVALLLAQGASNRQVARRLSISPHTVRSHAEMVFRKLGIHSRKGLGLRLISAWDQAGEGL